MWWSHFLKWKPLTVVRKWCHPFSVSKTLRVIKTWWSPFSVLKTLRGVTQWWSSFWVSKAFRAVRNWPSPFSEVTFHYAFMMPKYPGTIFSLLVPINFFDYNNILISTKDAEHISVNTVRAIFQLHTQCQKQPSRVFRHTVVLNIFGNTGGRVLILVITAREIFTFNPLTTAKFWLALVPCS